MNDEPNDVKGGALPNAVYSARGRARRLESGGEPIGGTLKPEAGQALRSIVGSGAYPTKLAAIEASVIREADRLRRKQQRPPGVVAAETSAVEAGSILKEFTVTGGSQADVDREIALLTARINELTPGVSGPQRKGMPLKDKLKVLRHIREMRGKTPAEDSDKGSKSGKSRSSQASKPGAPGPVGD